MVGFDADGRIAFRRKIKRLTLTDTFRKLPPCVFGMEACLSAHFVSRTLRQLGHEPRIIPDYFAKGQKNDYNDAEAIAMAERSCFGLRVTGKPFSLRWPPAIALDAPAAASVAT